MYGLSGNNLAIGVSLVLRDRFTGRARAAAASLNQLDKQARAAQMRQMEMQRNINAVGAGIGLMAIRGMTRMAKVGADFGYTMNYVKTIAEQKGGIGFDQLSTKAKTLGADTMFTARQVADAMKFMAMAGQDTAAIYNNVNAAVALAGATMSRLEGKGGTADIMTNIMRGFDINATEKNSMRVADVLTLATTSANTNLWDLHEAMKYSISTAKDLNVSLEETAGMVMMAGDAGIQGSMAGTATENMLRYITRAADESRKGRAGEALGALGLGPSDLQDAKGNLLAISPLLKVIGGRIESIKQSGQAGNVRAQNILTDLFGVRGKREASLLLRNMQQYDTYINKLNTQATGKALGNLESQMSTLKGVGKQLSSAWETVMINFTEAIEPVVIPLLKAATSLAKVLAKAMDTPLGKWLTVGAAGFIVMKTATMGYRAVVLSLRLVHAQMGGSLTTSASRVVGGYNAMTAAATRYSMAARGGAAASGMGMMGLLGFGGKAKWNPKSGRYHRNGGGRGGFVSAAAAQRYYGMSRRGTGVGMGRTVMGRIGNIAGKGSMIGMLGGLGLSMAGDAVGGEAGKYMSMGGNALGWAGTGAMVGSLVGPIGTATGAIVGGIGSLLFDLYNDMKEVEDAVDEAKGKKKEFNAEEWKKKAIKMQSMYEGDVIYGRGLNKTQLMATDRQGANQYLHPNGQFIQPNRIIINIDGKEAMDKVVQENNYRQLISLAAF